MELPAHSQPPGAPRSPAESGSFLERLGAWRSASSSGLPSHAPAQPVGRPRGKRLIISVTRKGGVGKSFFLATLADWFTEQRIPFLAMDADWCNGSLTRFLPDARFMDVAGGNPVEDVNAALSERDVILVDGFGPLQAYIFDWLKDCNFFADYGVPVALTYVLMVEEDKDSVFQAGEALRALAGTGSWLVVRNLKTCPTTEIYNTSDARQELLRNGAVEIQMDRVPWNLLLHVQRSGRTMRALSEEASLPFLERQRLKSYLAKFYEQAATAQSILLPQGMRRTVEPPAIAPPTAPSPHPAETFTSRGRPRIAPDRV